MTWVRESVRLANRIEIACLSSDTNVILGFAVYPWPSELSNVPAYQWVNQRFAGFNIGKLFKGAT